MVKSFFPFDFPLFFFGSVNTLRIHGKKWNRPRVGRPCKDLLFAVGTVNKGERK